MGVDINIYGGIVLILEDIENPERIVKKLKRWVERHPDDIYGWKLDYSEYGDQIDISFENPKRGSLSDYITGLIKFLKYCKRYDIYAMDTLAYMEAWGDYATGSVWISSEKEVAIITGMTNFGDRIDETIEWKDVGIISAKTKCVNTTATTIDIPSYPYGFPSNQKPDLDNKTIVFESKLPITIELSYTSDFLPTTTNSNIKISKYASLAIDIGDDKEAFTLTSSRHKYTLFELANAIVQSVLTQIGSNDDVWYTYKLTLNPRGSHFNLTQEANH